MRMFSMVFLPFAFGAYAIIIHQETKGNRFFSHFSIEIKEKRKCKKERNNTCKNVT